MSDLTKSGVYIIENIINKKVYIGMTSVTFLKRFKQHKAMLKRNIHASRILQNSYNKYGENNFTFEVLEVIEDQKLAREIEQKWIDIIQPSFNMASKVNNPVTYDSKVRGNMSRGKGGKPFEAYNPEGELVGIFESQGECSIELKVDRAEIGRALRGTRVGTKGYKFKYVGEDDFKFVPKEKIEVDRELIKQKRKEKYALYRKQIKSGERQLENGLDFTDWNFKVKHARGIFKAFVIVCKDNIEIGRFESLLEAGNHLNIDKKKIEHCLKTKTKQYAGYTFKKELKERI